MHLLMNMSQKKVNYETKYLCVYLQTILLEILEEVEYNPDTHFRP